MALRNYPTGTILPFPNVQADSIPNGWLLCDGSAVNRGGYGELFSLIGETYGAGDTTTTFNVPNLQEWFIKSVDSSTMTSGEGVSVNSSVHLQNEQYTYDLQAQVAQSQYTDSSDTGPFNHTSSSAGDHRHSFTYYTDTRSFGSGLNDSQCLDNMLPVNPIAAQGKVHHRFGNVQVQNDFLYHETTGHWTQHGSNTHAHAAQADVYNYYCPELAASASSQHQCTAGAPTCSTQMVDIGITASGNGKYTGITYGYHDHYICEEYQVQSGNKVSQSGNSAYQANYSSKRLFNVHQAHTHGGSLSVNEQSGITHGSTEHQFSSNVTATLNVASGYPGEGTTNSSGDLKPAALVLGFIIKT